jgi:DNA topoisomerase-2
MARSPKSKIISYCSSKGGYNVRGIWEVDDANEQLNIMELPLKKWTKDYKEMLEKMIQDESDQNVVDYREYHTKHRIHFQLQMNEGLIRNINIEKHFKLASTISTLNLVLFNPQGKLRKYANVIEIMEEYFALRVHLYDKRKDYLASKLEREIQILDNKVHK